MDNTTYSEFASLPSAQDNPFRSIKAEVSTETETNMMGTWAEADADFTIADGRSIATFAVGVNGFIAGPNTHGDLAEDLASARSDLAFFKAQFDAWYVEAEAALDEFAKAAGL